MKSIVVVVPSPSMCQCCSRAWITVLVDGNGRWKSAGMFPDEASANKDARRVRRILREDRAKLAARRAKRGAS